MLSPRTQHIPFSSTTTTTPASPPKTPPRGRRPSLSHPMTWLTRSSTNGSTHSARHPPVKPPYAPSKPVRISEPKFTNSLDILNTLRSGPLGTGATVVRTPQEALFGTAVQLTFEGDDGPEKDCGDDESEYDDYEEEGDHESKDLPSPPESPAILPVPMSRSTPCLLEKTESTAPSRPTRVPPPPPIVQFSPVRRSSLKMISPPVSEYSPPVPPLPRNIASSPPQPPFEPILVSPVPTSAIDPTKIIVSLETSTTTHRTTLSTLTSRPSYLSSFLTSLLPRCKRDSDANSVHSSSGISDTTHSPFDTLFHNHLTSSGLLPASTSSIHIFLDRPSAPYAHILSFLRSPLSTPEAPDVLPRAVQLISSAPSRLEGLLELRDEAHYLDLKELYKLCTDEIRQRQSPSLRGRASSSVSGESVHSLHPLRERAEQESCDSYDTTNGIHHVDGEMGVRASSYAIPQFTAARGRSTKRCDSLRSAPNPPPAGWI